MLMKMEARAKTRKRLSHFDHNSKHNQYAHTQTCTVVLVLNLFLASSICLVHSLNTDGGENHGLVDKTFRSEEALKRLKSIRAHLKKINKPAIKSIQSPDGDVIDCVNPHQQNAFDHPLLKGQKPLLKDPPAKPKGYNESSRERENFQVWSLNGESCPEETIPTRRTTEEDMLRAGPLQRFGRKQVRGDSPASVNNGHEYAIGSVTGQEHYGAKASINLWSPAVDVVGEFSLAQIWVLSGSYEGDDLNTIEAGWQIFPRMYGDNQPRFFIYWTKDAYKTTGCYNLLCPGFVQTNNGIVIGGAIFQSSSYNVNQFDISFMIWKDVTTGNWWLQLGEDVVGYWPSTLFTNLQNNAMVVQFGGEIINTKPNGFHTTTQMGSGHFAGEGLGKAAYFRNLELVDHDNKLNPVYDLILMADHSNCYNIIQDTNTDWGHYFYYGGPGKNPQCP